MYYESVLGGKSLYLDRCATPKEKVWKHKLFDPTKQGQLAKAYISQESIIGMFTKKTMHLTNLFFYLKTDFFTNTNFHGIISFIN